MTEQDTQIEQRLAAQDEKIDKLVDSLAGLSENVSSRLADQREQIDALGKAVIATQGLATVQVAAASEPPPEVASLVEDNIARFFSPISNYKLVMEHGAQYIVGNKPVSVPQKTIEFANGIKDVDTSTPEGEAIVAFLTSHADFEKDFWIDPTARPKAGPTVVDGPRGTVSGPRGQKPAALAARA